MDPHFQNALNHPMPSEFVSQAQIDIAQHWTPDQDCSLAAGVENPGISLPADQNQIGAATFSSSNTMENFNTEDFAAHQSDDTSIQPFVPFPDVEVFHDEPDYTRFPAEQNPLLFATNPISREAQSKSVPDNWERSIRSKRPLQPVERQNSNHHPVKRQRQTGSQYEGTAYGPHVQSRRRDVYPGVPLANCFSFRVQPELQRRKPTQCSGGFPCTRC
ncbi:hypothetical protein K458DRAFT_491055 [Lentithecium fluviatile CBS 122367]|uniref:Uncharacterized protein n=1 Tax=Lentithecium fluviatile CBS 122367 TaxID=1168545 RepID=A0A6G1IK80_9PLEO|nr:hypothetical protein K458DRAFT_491055 [Lentithecium fluviatile CBS 122367]